MQILDIGGSHDWAAATYRDAGRDPARDWAAAMAADGHLEVEIAVDELDFGTSKVTIYLDAYEFGDVDPAFVTFIKDTYFCGHDDDHRGFIVV